MLGDIAWYRWYSSVQLNHCKRAHTMVARWLLNREISLDWESPWRFFRSVGPTAAECTRWADGTATVGWSSGRSWGRTTSVQLSWVPVSDFQKHGFPDVYISKFRIWQRLLKLFLSKNATSFLRSQTAASHSSWISWIRSSLGPSQRFATEYHRMALQWPVKTWSNNCQRQAARNSSISSNCWIAMQPLP